MEDFKKLEYQTLRKEIEESKSRLFLVVSGGLSITTTADYFAIRDNVGIFSLLLPFLVLAFGLLFLSQHNAKFRAGRYIKDRIEPHPESGKSPGWENWLEEKKVNREADKFIKMGFLLIFFMYYSFSTYLAVKSLECLPFSKTFEIQHLILTILAVIGMVSILYFISNLATSTNSQSSW